MAENFLIENSDFSIKLLDKSSEKNYESFVLKNHQSSIYYSLAYRDLLKEVLLNSEEKYFIAIDKAEKIVGIFPSFVFEQNDLKILNSLPFYGSHGAPLVKNSDQRIYEFMLVGYEYYAKKNGIDSSTVISNINDVNADLIPYTYLDFRIGQINYLPKDDNEDNLMSIFHQKTRNMVRKGQKKEFNVYESDDIEDWDWLFKTHQSNMKEINGISKPKIFFESLRKNLKGKYKLFIAKKDNERAAGLLLLYFKETIEYFTPVIQKEHRSDQPLSLLIFEAMKSGIREGYKIWNWGGTWKSQDGVYRFKSRWGAQDFSYRYFIKLYNDKILKQKKEAIIKNFPYFYTIPFENLNE